MRSLVQALDAQSGRNVSSLGLNHLIYLTYIPHPVYLLGHFSIPLHLKSSLATAPNHKHHRKCRRRFRNLAPKVLSDERRIQGQQQQFLFERMDRAKWNENGLISSR